MSVRRRPEPDPAQRRRQAHANELMLAVAARLLGEARLAGAFPTAPGVLGSFAARITPELGDDEHVLTDGEAAGDLPRSDYKVVLGEPEPSAVGISCRYGHHGDFGRLRIDGVLDEQGGSVGVSADDPEQRVELPEFEQEVMMRAMERQREAGGAEQIAFRGEEFLRALAVPPQPGAAAQVLAVELYGDGLEVHYTYDDPVQVFPTIPFEYYELAGVEPPIEDLLAAAAAAGGNIAPNISVRDDIGTEYRGGFASEGGMGVRHGESQFTPAVPATATRLIVSSYAGTVEVDL
jgi:hypothetical protein